MKKLLLFCFGCIILLFQNLFAASIKPADGDTLNYLHVMFKWEQMAGAKYYNLQVALNDTANGTDPFASSLVANVIDSSLLHIVTVGLEWNSQYLWKVNPVTATGQVKPATSVHTFYTAALPDTIPDIFVKYDNPLTFQPGITTFDLMRTGFLLAVDEEGKVIWFFEMDSDKYKDLKKATWASNGNIVIADGSASKPNGGWETTIDGKIIWKDPGGKSDLMYMITKTPNGNYMGLARVDHTGPIPEGPWKADFDTLGLDSIKWRSSKIMEYDPAGNLVWQWSPFGHLSYADYDSASFAKALAKMEHDWTHFNSLYYDPLEDVVYLSSRNLDRIIKVAHSTGNVLWNMGKEMASGEVSFGHDLGFNHQHAIELTPDRNLIMMDNGLQKNPPQSRALEIAVNENFNPPTAENVWEYVLPDSLFISSNGSAIRLTNGNTLITCRNEGVTQIGYILEVDKQGNTVWMLCTGLIINFYANRIPGMYAQAFSLVQPELFPGIGEPTIFLPPGDATISYELYNEGWFDENYHYQVIDYNQSFNNSGTVAVNAGQHVTLSFSGSVYEDIYPTRVTIIVTPETAPALADTSFVYIYSTETSIKPDDSQIPANFALHQNFPNPFNPNTSIAFDVAKSSRIVINVYNIQGQLVRTLTDAHYQPGKHVIQWDGADNSGISLVSGIYYYKIISPFFTRVLKMALIK